MGRIVHTALALMPQRGYVSAETMADDVRAALLLEGIETKAAAQTLRRLIVLPFRLLRPSEEIQFLTHSLPEAISVSLTGLDTLVARSSPFVGQFWGRLQFQCCGGGVNSYNWHNHSAWRRLSLRTRVAPAHVLG